MYDILIIGGGVSGTATARELSRYNAKIALLEKCEDLCTGTSKANSGIVHAGYDAKPGSLMAKLNVQGNEMMPELSKKLDFAFKQSGSFVVCHSDEGLPGLEKLLEQGKANGVKGLEIISGDKAREMEPNLQQSINWALYAPTAGIVCPFEMNIAFGENAAANGVEFFFDTEVQTITKTENGYTVATNNGDFEARVVVNAAGVYADKFHNMVSEDKIHITPRRGDYCLLDKERGGHVSSTIFALPDQFGKGVLVTPTVHGNLLLGPTAIDIEDKEATATTAEGIEYLLRRAGQSVSGIPMRKVITSFAGLRAHEDGHEFIIKELPDAPGFVDVAGIESPGLTSAPAIGVMAAGIVKDILSLTEKDNFIEERKGLVHFEALSKEEKMALIKENPAYGNIVCRCEKVTEGEIIDAIRRPLGAKSLDGVKRRTRAGMGRCQAGFCTNKTMEIIARELNISMDKVTKSGGQSALITDIVGVK